MNNKLAEIIFKAGAKRRNPGLFTRALELKKSDFYTLEQYKGIQEEKLKKLFSFIKEHSAFYKELITAEAVSNPHEFLKNLPVISKNDLVEFHDDLQCYNQFDKLFLAETSGSTGQPFRFKKNLNWDNLHRASIIRSYWWYKLQPWERNGYFWGYSFDSKQVLQTNILDALQNRFRLFIYDKKDLEVFLNKLRKATFLHGYSSVIYEVAQMAIELGFGPEEFPQLKMIKGTSEKIYNYYHEPVLKAFGHKIVSEYGAAETGIIAYECPHGKMHINEENVIIEEEKGEAIITNLNAYSLPVLRYKLGDSIKINTSEKCSCGRHSRIIDEVIGRIGKSIIGKTNKYPSLTLYYIFKNISIQNRVDIQYQGFQKEKGKLILKITRNLSPVERAWIHSESLKYFKKDIDLEIVENVQIHDKKGKLVDFKTLL